MKSKKAQEYINTHPLFMAKTFAKNAVEIAEKELVAWAERWISVEDELPPASDEDLLLKGIDDRGKSGIVDVGYMHGPGTSADNFISLGGVLVEVTHWRPIEHGKE